MNNRAEKLNNFMVKIISLLEDELSKISSEESEETLNIRNNNIDKLNKFVNLIEKLNKLNELTDNDLEMNQDDEAIIQAFLENNR
jgi:hypothetical protein